MCAATMTALRPEEQKRLTVPPGTVTGRPASRATLRPVLKPCGPSGKPVPMTTSSTSAGSSWGTFFKRSLTRWAATSSGRARLKDPRNDVASPGRLTPAADARYPRPDVHAGGRGPSRHRGRARGGDGAPGGAAPRAPRREAGGAHRERGPRRPPPSRAGKDPGGGRGGRADRG